MVKPAWIKAGLTMDYMAKNAIKYIILLGSSSIVTSMKTVLHFLSTILILVCTVQEVSAQSFQWVKGGGSTFDFTVFPSYETEVVKQMCIDQNGNIYVSSQVGSAPMTADTFHRSSAYGAEENVLITSYNCNGAMRWAKLIGASDGCRVYGMQVDKVGNLYLAGFFPGATLHIGSDTVLTSSASYFNANAIIQLDTLGHYRWIRPIGPPTATTLAGFAAVGNPVAIDRNNVLHYYPYVGSGVLLTSSVTSTRGVYDISFTSGGTIVGATRVDLDSQWYLTKAIIDTVTNKMYAVGNTGVGDTSFAGAFDGLGNLLWQHKCNYGAAVMSVLQDKYRQLYFAGGSQAYTGGGAKFVFNGDSTQRVGYGYAAILMKTDTSGHPYWVKDFAGHNMDFFADAAQMRNGNIAAAGTFLGVATNSTDSIISYAGEVYNPFLAIVDTAGDLLQLQQIHGSGYEDGALAVIASKTMNTLYIGGKVANSVWGGSITPYTTYGGNTDFFVLKYGVDCNCTTFPTASFTSTGSHTVTFNYTGTTTAIDSVRWTFGDGSTSAIFSPTHIYTAAGTYHACVRVYSACGNDVECKDIVIPCFAAPVSSYTSSGLGLTKNFTYTGTAGVDSVTWTFGDGGIATGTAPSHTYAAAGTYTVCATAHSLCGNHTYCSSIIVTCTSLPVAAFTFTVTGSTANFTYTGTTAGLDSVKWNYADASVFGIGLTAMHAYSTPGTYHVCCTVYTNCGTNTVCHDVIIACTAPPIAAFIHTHTGGSYNFSYTSSLSGIDSLRWHFGDGGTSPGSAPSHSYTSLGTYTVCITAYNACGSNTSCQVITVTCLTAAPTSSFTHFATNDSTGHFAYTGTGAVDSVGWFFGDTGHTVGTAVTHHYATTGTFTVCAVAYSPCGNDTLCDTIKIRSLVGVGAIAAFNDIRILPNPTDNQMMVENAGGCVLTIYSMVGKTILQEQVLTIPQTFLISQFAAGVYLVQVSDQNGNTKYLRLVKQ